MSDYPPLQPGTEVRTVAIDNPPTGWTEKTKKGRKFGICGVVGHHHNSNSLCYDVKHKNGSHGYYAPQELEVLYPEHVKLEKISDKSQAIHDFLEWTREKHNLQLGMRVEGYGGDALFEHSTQNEKALLAEHFDIDMQKLEEEKDAMIEELRQRQETNR